MGGTLYTTGIQIKNVVRITCSGSILERGTLNLPYYPETISANFETLVSIYKENEGLIFRNVYVPLGALSEYARNFCKRVLVNALVVDVLQRTGQMRVRGFTRL